ncbi:MAG TPA: hypothetical protein VFM30_10505, partial [Steroidobacteraceae bacterium]|nr:hypothetical protein [Steroidobacteraceae bacterium]
MNRISATVAAVLAACAAAGQVKPTELTDAERGIAQLAIETLAADLKSPADGILVDTVRAVDWRDSSLGCPKPG